MKVKLVELHENCLDNDDYNITEYYIRPASYTDWEEVTDEECNILKEWIRNNNRNAAHIKYTLLVDKNIPIKPVLQNYLIKAKKEIAAKKAIEAAKAEKQRKRKETLAKKKAEKERRLLERLLEKKQRGELD